MAQRTRIAVYALFVAAVALAAGWSVTREISLSHDSMLYALVADEIAAGRGIRQPVLRLDQTPDADGTVPATVQPPLLPLLLAGLGGVDAQRQWPVRLINMASLLVAALGSFYIARRLAMDETALAAGLCVAVGYPMLSVGRYLWSEPPFVALMVGSVALLLASRTDDRRATAKLFAASLLAAGAFATRFAGVALLPLFAWEAWRTGRRAGPQTGLTALGVGLTLPLLAAALLWGRNLALTGSIRGDWPGTAGRGALEALASAVELLAINFGFFGIGQELLAAGVLAVPAVVLVRALVRRRDLRAELSAGGVDMLVLGLASYLAVIVWALARWQPNPEPRFAAPLGPLMVILVAVVIDRGWRIVATGNRGPQSRCIGIGDPSPARPALAAGGVTVSLGLMLAYMGMVAFVLLWFDRYPEPHPAGRSQTLAWLLEHAPPGARIVTNEPAQTAFYGRFVSIGLPNRIEDPRAELPADLAERLPRRMIELGAGYLVLYTPPGLAAFANPLRNDEPFGPFIAALARRQSPADALVIVHDGPDGVVYALPAPIVQRPARQPARPPATAPDASPR